MTISFIGLKDSLNKAYRLIKPRRTDLNSFKTNMLTLLNHLDEKETEENVKIHLMDFLKNTFYHPEHLIATKGRTDFVIHTGKDAQTPAGVLFEVKKPTNKTEMVTKNNLNAKAMHELILYFLRERVNNKNNSLTNLVITNIYEWFVFDASEFERIFTQNTQLQKAFKEWEGGQKVSTKTDLFYNEIIKPFLVELDKTISFTHFDIRDYEKVIKNTSEKDDNKLIPLFKFFTPVHLLKLTFINDSNSLDKGFFAELLHIIGLEEVKDGSRKIIRRLPVGKRHHGSLIENTLNILEVEDTLRKVSGKYLNGKTKEEQLFNLSLELTITWINRVLFLKLLEAQLIKYHNGDTKYRFLNIQTIRDFDELYKLFFQVLAKQNSERQPLIQQKYGHIPYLNSSLFEISELEDETIKVNGLDDHLDIDLYGNTVLRKGMRKGEGSMMNTLHYLFEFLDAYDFASVGKEEVQEQNKTIINAAVLGLVFEKINGYRDGSIYTPGAVTMFLCRETIRKAVVKKFNDTYGWHCESIADTSNYLSDKRTAKDILEFNKVIEGIRIADPAVGSGHFLVSSLNELIAIKAELGILADSEGKRLTGIDISIANDELLVTDQAGNFFEYSIASGSTYLILPETQRIQQTLFEEKRKIIEGCLFGVDINPNSVKICRLRLWIELLKHAYYKAPSNVEQTSASTSAWGGETRPATFVLPLITFDGHEPELETLPNIDINIKHGNSLLSKYSLDEDLSEVFRKQKFGIKDYQLAVEAYKEAPNKDAKTGLQDFIKTIKEQFHETVSRRDPRRKKLSELRGQLLLTQNNLDLFGKKKTEKEVAAEVKKLSLNIEKIEKDIAEIENNAVYRNAFEWRFEFPEVLNESGDFEGFEVIIGNPPYIQLQKMGEDADVLQKCGYKTFTRTGDIYCLFYEQANRLLKPGYYFGFITSNKWMRANYGQSMREYFIKETNPLLLVDFGGYQVFDSATVDTNLLICQKASYRGQTETCLIDKSFGSLEKMSVFINSSKNITEGFKAEAGWVILSPVEAAIKLKIETIGTPLKNWDINIYRGILTGYNEAFIIDGKTKDELIMASPKNAEIIRPIIRGRDIKSYNIEHEDKWIIFTKRGIEIDMYPAVKKYLYKYYENLVPRNNGERSGRKPGPYKWYEIQDNVAYYKDFEKDKIVWIELTDKPNFALDTNRYYINNTIFFITGKHLKYLLAFLNSKLCEWYFDKIAATSGVGTRRWIKIYIDQICVPYPTLEVESKLEALVDLMNADKSAQVKEMIDQEIYNIYSLSAVEIEFVSNAAL